MQIHELKRHTPQKTATRIGRGGKRGKTSGRGHKGQKSRAGTHKARPELRDRIKKLPKLRGYKFNPFKQKAMPVNVGVLNNAFNAGETVTPEALIEKNIIERHRGKAPAVKILGGGELTVKLTVSGCTISESAKEKIEKAGGSVSSQASGSL